MPPRRSALRALPPLLALSFALPAPAPAHETAGGAAVAPARPEVSLLKCATGDRRTCPAGEFLAIRGEDLRNVSSVVFLGRAGSTDDRAARPRRRSPHRVLVRVPSDALSGRLRVVSRIAGAATTARRLTVISAAPMMQPTNEAGVFPVDGAHDFGTRTNRFGGGRGHQGQDVFAACGTPIVAALAGVVTTATYQSRAGHFAVVTADDGTSQVYMHMQRKALVRRGQTIAAGTPLGAVGDSGSAEGCHLHFELWTAPGWYRGGEPVDPLPALRQWEAAG
jgi:murein DD-endopeptidase MepM/ murein hydrolase activator NlpD